MKFIYSLAAALSVAALAGAVPFENDERAVANVDAAAFTEDIAIREETEILTERAANVSSSYFPDMKHTDRTKGY